MVHYNIIRDQLTIKALLGAWQVNIIVSSKVLIVFIKLAGSSCLNFHWPVSLHTGCPKKNALLSLKAHNSGLEGAIGTSRDSFEILRLWAFIWDQEVQDYVEASLRKTRLKLATLLQNLTFLYHRYSPLIMNVLQCLCQAQVPKSWAKLDWG